MKFTRFDLPVSDTHSFETDLMKFSRTTSLEPSLSLHAFLYSHVGKISPPLLVKMPFQKAVLVTNHVVGVEGHCMVYFRVDQRLVNNLHRPMRLLGTVNVPGSQVIANTAL